jgi:hypothetical protein
MRSLARTSALAALLLGACRSPQVTKEIVTKTEVFADGYSVHYLVATDRTVCRVGVGTYILAKPGERYTCYWING